MVIIIKGEERQGRLSKDGFLEIGERCIHEDAWSSLSLEEIIKDKSNHCDPTQLLICVRIENGLKICKCGLINAVEDEKTRRCLALVGAPCLKLFNSNYNMTLTKCERGSVCVLPGRQPVNLNGKEEIFNYHRCTCASGAVDEKGGCTGWGSVGQLTVSLVTLVFSTFLYSCQRIGAVFSAEINVLF